MTEVKTVMDAKGFQKAEFHRARNGVVTMTIYGDSAGFRTYCFTDVEFNEFYEQVRKARM